MGHFPLPWKGVDDVLILGGAVPSGLIGQAGPISFDYAPRELPRLHEFNIVIIDPLITQLISDQMQKFELNASTDLVRFEKHRAMFFRRRDELEELLRTGGVVVVFLRGPSALTAQFGPTQWEQLDALELLAQKYWLRAFSRREQAGRSGPPVDPEDPMTPYLNLRPDYVVTVEGGLLADEAHGYPLAYTRDGLVTAFVEYVGRGTVYWLPPPPSPRPNEAADAWHVLIDCARLALGPRGYELDAIADDDLIRKLESAAADALRSHAVSRREIQAELKTRVDMLENDAALASAVRHFNTARTATPRRALDHFSRMHEVIKKELGGQHKAARLLGYHQDLPDAFTFPANEPAHQVRHASSGPAEVIPPEVLANALAAAEEIISKFFRQRRQTVSNMKVGPTGDAGQNKP